MYLLFCNQLFIVVRWWRTCRCKCCTNLIENCFLAFYNTFLQIICFRGQSETLAFNKYLLQFNPFALQTLENRAKACSNLHIVNRDSAFTTTPSMCLESWRVKQNHLNSANLYLVRMVALISTDSAHLRASWQFPTLRKFLASLDRMLTSSGSRKWARHILYILLWSLMGGLGHSPSERYFMAESTWLVLVKCMACFSYMMLFTIPRFISS